ncbi:MAG: cytochrome c [Gammaproteobacteria bacterium]
MHRTPLLVLLALCAAAATASTEQSDNDPEMAERLVACASCHGEAGRSNSETYFPSIAGKPAGYLYAQLEHYRSGRRRHQIMEGLLANLSDEYLREIADYYARQEPKWTPPSLPEADARLERGRALVEDGDPAAAFRPASPGTEIPAGEVERLKLSAKDGKVVLPGGEPAGEEKPPVKKAKK